MVKKLMSNVHFQLRLVKELKYSDGRDEIITDRNLTSPKEGDKVDHTLDLMATELKLRDKDWMEDGDKLTTWKNRKTLHY